MKSRVCLWTLAIVATTPAWGLEVLMVDNPARPTQKANTFDFSGDLFAGNDMVPVNHFAGKPWPADYRARSGANLAVANERVSLGESRGDWSVSFFYRQDWLLKANSDTVTAHYLDQTGQLDSQVGRYNIDYALRGYSADGLRLGLSKPITGSGIGDGSWGVAVSLLHGYDVRLEMAKGELISGIGSASLVGSRQLFNSRMQAVASSGSFSAFIPAGGQQDVPAGWGYAMDLGARWHFQNGGDISVAVNDLLGRIQPKNRS